MKTELTNYGTYLTTGSYDGRRFIAEEATLIESMHQGYAAIDVIMMRLVMLVRLAGKTLPAMLREQAQ